MQRTRSQPHVMRRRAFIPLFLVLGLSAGCEPVTLTLLGVGAATGVSYRLDSIAYKTFTAPIDRVRRASMKALKRMGIQVFSKGRNEQGELVITAAAQDRQIEVVLESITPKATRIRTIARIGPFLMDRATATEIIIQTERILVGV